MSVVSYYLADHLGGIVQTTDSTGAVTLSREYDPWGECAPRKHDVWLRLHRKRVGVRDRRLLLQSPILRPPPREVLVRGPCGPTRRTKLVWLRGGKSDAKD